MEQGFALGSRLVDLAVTYIPKLAGFTLLVIGAWVVASTLGRLTRKQLSRSGRLDKTLVRFAASLVHYGVLAAALVGCLGMFGFETASFAAVLASAGLAVGLAFQGTLSNFASGVMLLMFRPFKTGDVVRTAGELATVESVELFTTELTTFDNRRVIVPNSAIFGSKIENLTHHATRRVDLSVGVAYDADIDATRKVLESVAPAIDKALKEPGAAIVLTGLGASSVDWSVRIWAKKEDYWEVYQEGYRQIKQRLDEAGIGIPFPQMDLHLDRNVVDALGSEAATSRRAPAA